MPEKRFYKKPQQPTTEVAIRARCARTSTSCSAATTRKAAARPCSVFVNPLVMWLWLGGFVIVLGTAIVMSPTAAEQRALAAALAVEEHGLEPRRA